MANEKNLKPLNTLPKSEQRKIQKKGNIASAKVRKEKATMRKAMEWLLNSDIKVTKGSMYDVYKAMGIDISILNTSQLATLGLWYGAVMGNASNFRAIMEANNEIDELGATSTPTLKIEVTDNSNLEKAMYDENKHRQDDKK